MQKRLKDDVVILKGSGENSGGETEQSTGKVEQVVTAITVYKIKYQNTDEAQAPLASHPASWLTSAVLPHSLLSATLNPNASLFYILKTSSVV